MGTNTQTNSYYALWVQEEGSAVKNANDNLAWSVNPAIEFYG